MDWYYIVLIVIVSLLVLLFLILLFCFFITFYSSNKKSKNDAIILPNQKIYNKYKKEIIQDIQDARKLNYELFKITSFDNLKLYGKFYEYEKDAPIEIMIHGYRGSGERDLSTGIKRAFKCKHSALIIDQRGSGLSEGHIITFGIKEHIDCIYWAQFVSQKFKHNQIILTGISMGAATVLIASSLELPKNVVGIIADCGYNKASDIIKKVIKEMKLPPAVFYPFEKIGAKIFGHFNLEETSPYESVQNSRVPTIFLHGDEDS